MSKRGVSLADAPLCPREALGLVFVVDCPDAQVVAYLTEALQGLLRDSSGGAAVTFKLASDQAQGSQSVGQALSNLIGDINLGAIAAAEGKLLFHAGAVCGSNGGVAVICGPSGSGKSTLTARLVESGLAYVTDETTCVDPDTMLVTPFRKPLSLKPGSRRLFAHLQIKFDALPDWFLDDDAWLIPHTALGGSPLPSVPLVPQILVFPEYSVDEPPGVEPLSQGEAAFMLGGNSSRLRSVRGGPLLALAKLVAQAPGYRVRYDDVDVAADQVRELVAA